MASAITVQRKRNVALWKNWRGELGKSGRMSASSCEVWYLFIEKPSFCDVALIRPGLAPGPPSPSGKALATLYKLEALYLFMKPGGTPMDSMWLEVILNVKAEEMDALCATLIANGVPGLAVEEEEEFRAFLEENRQYWDYVDDELMEQMKGVSRVKFYVTDDADGKKQLAGYLQDIDLPYTTVPLREYDWAHSWQKYYKPMEVGQRLLMNPGLTFGTGSHASTQLCLEGVEAHTKPNDLVLDLGCGSGILAIAALCLGARFATGVDIDPKAVDVAYENAALNGIGKDRCRFLAGNVLADQSLVNELAQEKADLVLANIVADVIIPLAPVVPRLLKEDGVFLCSGIIDTRGDEVAAALEAAGLHVIRRREKTGWIALEAKQK